MIENNIQPAKLHIIIQHIKRAPMNWEGISLICLKPSGKHRNAAGRLKKLTRNISGKFIFAGKNGEQLCFASNLPREEIPALAEPDLVITDIAEDWFTTCKILDEASRGSSAPTFHDTISTIMVVEDEPLTSLMVAHYLERYGTVITAVNSREAVANYMVYHPDIVFLDIHYQEDAYDGFDVLSNLLSADKHAQIIFVSGDSNPATILKSLSYGAQGYIAKPFHAKDFAGYLQISKAG